MLNKPLKIKCMKKLTFITFLLFCFSYGINAQTNNGTESNFKSSVVFAENTSSQSVNIMNPNATTDFVKSTNENSKNNPLQTDFLKKHKKKKPVWKYIVGGTFIVLVTVFYVVTGGEGYHSR